MKSCWWEHIFVLDFWGDIFRFFHVFFVEQSETCVYLFVAWRQVLASATVDRDFIRAVILAGLTRGVEDVMTGMYLGSCSTYGTPKDRTPTYRSTGSTRYVPW